MATVSLLFLVFAAAAVAAFAGWEQVAQLKKTARAELRAYLSVEPARTVPIVEGRITRIPLKIVNSGKTHAFDLTFDDLNFQATPERFEKQDLIFAPRDFRPLGIGFVPRQTSRIRLFTTNHAIDPEAMRKGTHRLYSTGKIFYDDVWGDVHWVTFCIWWGTNGFAPEDAAYCNRHNDTDRPEKFDLP
jgi:hypothetical protein